MHRIRLHSLGYIPTGKPGKHTVAHAWDSRDNPARRRPGAGDEYDLPFLETQYFRTRAQAEKGGRPSAADLRRGLGPVSRADPRAGFWLAVVASTVLWGVLALACAL